MQRLEMRAAMCDVFPSQCTELVQAFQELANFLASVAKSKTGTRAAGTASGRVFLLGIAGAGAS
eukprot:9472263-Pyramimonas_sp.AAC.1